jgi:Sulfotransferase domain
LSESLRRFEWVGLVVSSGRTGTKALAQHLSEGYSQVCALHEPSPSWRLRRASSKALAGRISQPELVHLLESSRRGLLGGVTQPIYVESNPYLSGFVEVFGQVFGRVRVVHVVRDPRTYIRSGINFGVFRGFKQMVCAMVPWWLPRPELVDPAAPRKWINMTPAERLAWYWSTLNRWLDRGRDIYGENYLRIRFEELFARDGSGLARLTDWMGLPPNQQLAALANRENVNASQAEHCPKWEDWSESDRSMVMDYCGDLMGQYGYLDEACVARGAAYG